MKENESEQILPGKGIIICPPIIIEICDHELLDLLRMAFQQLGPIPDKEEFLDVIRQWKEKDRNETAG